MKRDYMAYAQRVHALNSRWWVDLETGKPLSLNLGERVMLIVSELGEALEGVRKGTMDDHLPQRPSVEVEMADTVIRLLDLMGAPDGRTFPVLKKFPQDTASLRKFEGDMTPEKEELTDMLTDNTAEGLLLIVKYALSIYEHKFWVDCALVISLCDSFCYKFGYDLWGAVEDKLNYNSDRRDHTREGRLEEGGKKF